MEENQENADFTILFPIKYKLEYKNRARFSVYISIIL